MDETPGEEAGIKSISLAVSGPYVYGLLKHEAGVHRLVRQSPFNADKLRQTSFAMVEVLPQIDQAGVIEIKDDEIEFDAFRAGGHGGKTSTKSRVQSGSSTFQPVLSSLLQLRDSKIKIEFAMKLLKAKLWQRQEEERHKEEQRMKGGMSLPVGAIRSALMSSIPIKW